MKTSIKDTVIALLLLLVVILSFKLGWKNLFDRPHEPEVSSTIVVERIQKVMKLIAVEGNYSELMTYRDFSYVDFPGFRKDAIVKVNAKVSVGYNLEKLQIAADDKNKTIRISNMPAPEILSIDTDIDFEHLDAGLFTSFDAKEISKMNALAKEQIAEKALSADLIRQAEEQRKDLFELIFYMATQNGYTITIEGKTLEPIKQLKQ